MGLLVGGCRGYQGVGARRGLFVRVGFGIWSRGLGAGSVGRPGSRRVAGLWVCARVGRGFWFGWAGLLS